MPLDTFREGGAHEVLVYCKPNGTCPVRDFLDGLQRKERLQMLALIQYASTYGPPKNREKNHLVEGRRYFEFKTHGQRIFWRWSHRSEIILMHGFTKQTDRIPARELAAGDITFGLIEEELS